MDARERLRRMLEQRLELGEREVALHGVDRDEALQMARSRGERSTPHSGGHSEDGESRGTDWRETLRAAGAAPGAFPARAPARAAQQTSVGDSAETSRAAPAPAQIPGARPGISVGAESRELFDVRDEQYQTLDDIARAVASCSLCTLRATAKNPVPGVGNPNAELVCVGEAPGATEDEQGEPFVGQAGKLLNRILAAIDLQRDDVFICNVLKHRPPGNRNPVLQEIEACKPFLVRQLEIIGPKVVLALGTFAAQTLLETKAPIGTLRGAVHRYYGIPLIATYHPAALLRNPALKRQTWEDVQLVRRILDTTSRAA